MTESLIQPMLFHRPHAEGKSYWGPGDLYTFLATGEETDNAYFQFEAIVPPGGGPPPHIHRGEDEIFYLAEGSLEMQLGDKSVIVNTGDFVNVPRGTAHSFRNIGTKTAKLVVTFVPAGMEKYFEAVFPVATDRTATPPPVTPALIEKMKAEAAAHRVEFIPPENVPKR